MILVKTSCSTKGHEVSYEEDVWKNLPADILGSKILCWDGMKFGDGANEGELQ